MRHGDANPRICEECGFLNNPWLFRWNGGVALVPLVLWERLVLSVLLVVLWELFVLLVPNER